MSRHKPFQFRHFSVFQEKSPAKVGTDGILLGAWAPAPENGRILDIGTGTGLIGLMLAQRAPATTVDAVEVHPGAAEEAAQNFARSPWADRLHLHPSDVRALAQECPHKYDLIVSNPPFFKGGLPSPDPERRGWRQQAVLPLEDLFAVASGLLQANGRFCLILPAGGEAEAALQLAAVHEMHLLARTNVRARAGKAPYRVLLAFSALPVGQCQTAELIVQEGGPNAYSADYIALTRAFYPWMDVLEDG